MKAIIKEIQRLQKNPRIGGILERYMAVERGYNKAQKIWGGDKKPTLEVAGTSCNILLSNPPVSTTKT